MDKIGGRRAKRQRIADYALIVMEPGEQYPAREIVRMMVDYIPYFKHMKRDYPKGNEQRMRILDRLEEEYGRDEAKRLMHLGSLIMRKAYVNARYDIPCQYELIKILKGDDRFTIIKEDFKSPLLFTHTEVIEP